MKTNNLQLSFALMLGILAVTGALAFLGVLGNRIDVVYAQGSSPQEVSTTPGNSRTVSVIGDQCQLLTQSNPVTEVAIIINNSREGWGCLLSFPPDPAGDGGGPDNIDWRGITMAHDSDELYVRYEIDDGPAFFPDGFRYNVFVDVDRNRNTGYRRVGKTLSIGADVLFQGAYDAVSEKTLVYRFAGSNQEIWVWTPINTYLTNDKPLSGTKRDIEWKGLMSDLNIFGTDVTRFDWVALADNANGVYDFYPDGGDGGDTGDFYSYTYHPPTIEMLIPLYSYPNWYDPSHYIWDDVAAAACNIPITAVINPNNGPGIGGPNSDYQRGLKDLRSGCVTILGYVYTSYGTRPITDVKADIDQYDQYFNIHGIFLDESAYSCDNLPYYQELYDYVKAKPNLYKVFLNPGRQIDECYIAPPAVDTAVIFEGPSNFWPPYLSPPYLCKCPARRFATLVHSVPDAATMRSHIDLAVARCIGYVYVTDNASSNPYDHLPAFWQDEVNYIKSLNGDAALGGFCQYLPLIGKE